MILINQYIGIHLSFHVLWLAENVAFVDVGSWPSLSVAVFDTGSQDLTGDSQDFVMYCHSRRHCTVHTQCQQAAVNPEFWSAAVENLWSCHVSPEMLIRSKLRNMKTCAKLEHNDIFMLERQHKQWSCLLARRLIQQTACQFRWHATRHVYSSTQLHWHVLLGGVIIL